MKEGTRVVGVCASWRACLLWEGGESIQLSNWLSEGLALLLASCGLKWGEGRAVTLWVLC
jgi:hypothetical protein